MTAQPRPAKWDKRSLEVAEIQPRGGRNGAQAAFEPVCRLGDLEIERGVTALVHGRAVAIFRTHDDQVYALGNHDPFAHASVLARGIVGTRGDVPFVASPMHKHAFDLRTGQCLDDEQVAVPTYQVRVVDGVIHVGSRT